MRKQEVIYIISDRGQIRAYQRAKDVQSQVQARVTIRDNQCRRIQTEQHQTDVVENSVEFRQARQEVKVAQQQSVPGANLDTGGENQDGNKTTSFTDAGTSLDTKV